MTKTPTVYDVAERAAVSIATVSRVLRSSGPVTEATRDRVLAAVRELGYVPSASARGLAARRTNVIGLFFPGHDDLVGDDAIPLGQTAVPIVSEADDTPENENLYYDEVLRGAEIEAWRHGFALMVASAKGASLESLVNDLAGRVDGLAVLSGTVPPELLAHVSRRIPVAILAGSGGGDDFDHVGANNGPGMRALADHLVAEGLTEVDYVAGPEGSVDDAERFAGFTGVLTPRRLYRGDFTRASGREVARAMVDLPRVVVCANDQMALGVLDVLVERGIRIPEDVAVTGFDGIAAGRHSRPTLTTVHQPMAELGRAAIHAITRRLDDPSIPRQQFTLPVRVVLRESCP